MLIEKAEKAVGRRHDEEQKERVQEYILAQGQQTRI